MTRRTALGGALILAALAGCSSPHPRADGPARPTTSVASGGSVTTARPTAPAATGAVPSTTAALSTGHPLAGRTIGIDPGHNGRNYSDPSFIDQQVFNGRQNEDCDTTGTETASGYTEAEFNWNVAVYLTADLQAEGAKVVLTRANNDSVGPCITTRAQIINQAGSAVAIDIHADGGPVSGRGFAILEPVADGPNDGVIGPSSRLAEVLRQDFQSVTGMPVSTYDGVDGLQPRDDLAGLNLTTVPKVLIECGNMRNATDAALLSNPAFQQSAARGMALAITQFLG